VTVPESDFESFVRERLNEICDRTGLIAAEVLRLGVREKEHTKLIDAHGRQLAAHDVLLDKHSRQIAGHDDELSRRAAPPTSIPPLPRPAHKSGSFSAEQIEETWNLIAADFDKLKAESAMHAKERERQEWLADEAAKNTALAEKRTGRILAWGGVIIAILTLAVTYLAWSHPH
jgi:hypothetical protein